MGQVPGQPFPASNAVIQMAVLHGSAGEDGRLSEVEVLASSDGALNRAGLDRANAFTQGQLHGQPGATAQSREVILTFAFVTQGP